MENEEYKLLDINLIDDPPDADRDMIDPEEVRQLAESIRSVGLQQAIVVRLKDGRYERVIGKRRILAHQLIGEYRIKAVIRDLSDDQADLIRSVENDQRVNLNPIERAKNYRRLHDKYGMSTYQIAEKVGRSHQTVMRYLKLLEVPEEFQNAVGKGKLAMAVAIALSEIDDANFRNYYFTAAVQNGVTVEVAEGWVNEYNKTRAGRGPSEGGGEGVGGPIQESLPVFQTCFCCHGPEEATKVQYVPLCRDCFVEVRGARKSEKG